MNPWLQAVMRIAQGHYGGNMNDPRAANWLRRLQTTSPEARTPLAQRVFAQLGTSDPSYVMSMPNH